MGELKNAWKKASQKNTRGRKIFIEISHNEYMFYNTYFQTKIILVIKTCICGETIMEIKVGEEGAGSGCGPQVYHRYW